VRKRRIRFSGTSPIDDSARGRKGRHVAKDAIVPNSVVTDAHRRPVVKSGKDEKGRTHNRIAVRGTHVRTVSVSSLAEKGSRRTFFMNGRALGLKTERKRALGRERFYLAGEYREGKRTQFSETLLNLVRKEEGEGEVSVMCARC